MQRLWTSKLHAAFLKLVVVFALVIATSGFGHPASHAPDHSLSNVVHEHSIISDDEADLCKFHSASSAYESQVRSVGDHQASVECCDGVCISFMSPQPREGAARVEASQTFSRAAEFEPSAAATADLRPPRVLT